MIVLHILAIAIPVIIFVWVIGLKDVIAVLLAFLTAMVLIYLLSWGITGLLK